jgi:acyl-CoA thioesterase-1
MMSLMNRIALAALSITLVSVSGAAQPVQTDWPNLQRHRAANAALPPPASGEKRVVFIGDSITDGWSKFFDEQFPGKSYVNRGIDGQTTAQMLVRFRQDVISLRPSVVVILGGINDIAGNGGPATPDMIENNLMSMVDLAHANGIFVVLCSLLPANTIPWRPELEPAPDVIALNSWMKRYAAGRHGVTYVDYWTAMAGKRDGLPETLSRDGVHPNETGYRIMAKLVEGGIAKALRHR